MTQSNACIEYNSRFVALLLTTKYKNPAKKSDFRLTNVNSNLTINLSTI
jgi:hypothetical protein